MIALFKRGGNGKPVGVNSDYVIRVYQERDSDMTWLEICDGNQSNYRLAVAGDIDTVVAKLNGKL